MCVAWQVCEALIVCWLTSEANEVPMTSEARHQLSNSADGHTANNIHCLVG